ncbi:MAG: sugar transferase [Elusimicrobiales bacterium]|jgi:lipopolysaccharide/colanic/teichoic acid biosynthesis glycosyltransferase
MRNSLYALYGKRVFDMLAAACGLLVLSPVFILAAIAVKLSGPGPVLFGHRRIGLDFRPFYTHKFRTMVAGADRKGSAITTGGDARITAVGRLLRKTKIDELPQLFNVLVGEMSLVGPRPEVAQYVELFREDYKTVLSVRPGITDYAAIEYRDEEGVLRELVGGEESPKRYPTTHDAYVAEVLPAKIALYKKYIAEQSFLTDIKIIIRTFGKIVG